MEYEYAEAVDLLETQQRNCETSLAELTEDCAFIKDQITMTEVNIARIYNHDVVKRREAKENEKKSAE